MPPKPLCHLSSLSSIVKRTQRGAVAIVYYVSRPRVLRFLPLDITPLFPSRKPPVGSRSLLIPLRSLLSGRREAFFLHCSIFPVNPLAVSEILPIFAVENEDDMEEKRYPKLEDEESVGMCCEPPAGYAATGSGYANTLSEENDLLPDGFDPGIGPYSMEELNARIDEAEVFIAQAEKGDWSNWVTEEQSRANLYRKYPWLR